MGNNTTFEYYEQAADKKYQGGLFHDLFLAAQSNRLVKINNKENKEKMWMWSLHKELFCGCTETYILTYMFDCSTLKCFFDINGLSYQKLFVKQLDNGVFQFTDEPVNYFLGKNLRNKIHICDNVKLNKIGDNKNALSHSWVERESECQYSKKLDQLRKNIIQFFKYYHPDISFERRLWSIYECGTAKIRDKGFYRSDLAFNSRATNDYGHKTALAYCVNIFCNPNIVYYYKANEIQFDEDGYALSIMLQWIWRSAIRNGEDIYLYIPSRRMREMLIKWLDEVSKEEQQWNQPA